jgi:peptidoglycan hydrolase-like protein with peptidoglycan-binding domain
LLRIDALILEMQLVKKEVETLTGGSVTPTGSVLGAQTTEVFTESLAYGETNDDIAKIQTLLATDPEIYPYGVVSGFFGPNTEEAIRNLQTRVGLDPVGAIGPATTELLEGYMRMYPSGDFPADALKQKPQVLGASTTAPPSTPSSPTTGTVSGSNPLLWVDAEHDRGEVEVSARFKNGDRESFIVDANSENEAATEIASRLGLSYSFVKEVIIFVEKDDDDDNDHDEDDAEEAIEEAEEAIDDADDEIFEAEEDGEDVDFALDTLDEAEDALDEAEDAFDDEDWDEAVELAEEAKDLAEEAEDRIGEEEDDDDNEKGDSDEIESIEAEVSDGETEVTVEYENDDDYTFTVDEDDEDEIIEEVADELNIDEDDVEDLINFDYD